MSLVLFADEMDDSEEQAAEEQPAEAATEATGEQTEAEAGLAIPELGELDADELDVFFDQLLGGA